MNINTNISKLFTKNYLRNTSDELEEAIVKLSSGKRINSNLKVIRFNDEKKSWVLQLDLYVNGMLYVAEFHLQGETMQYPVFYKDAKKVVSEEELKEIHSYYEKKKEEINGTIQKEINILMLLQTLNDEKKLISIENVSENQYVCTFEDTQIKIMLKMDESTKTYTFSFENEYYFKGNHAVIVRSYPKLIEQIKNDPLVRLKMVFLEEK